VNPEFAIVKSVAGGGVARIAVPVFTSFPAPPPGAVLRGSYPGRRWSLCPTTVVYVVLPRIHSATILVSTRPCGCRG